MAMVGNVQLVRGSASSLVTLFARLRGEGIEPEGNPDVYVREYASFGVEEARELAQRAGTRAVAASRRVFIMAVPGMTNEAQNALLKTFEEPAGDALFFLVTPSPQQLLPTLRSRAQLFDHDEPAGASRIDVRAFVKARPGERIDMLKPLLDKDEDEKRDLAGAISFLAALESELSADPQRQKEGIDAVYRARKYIGDKGSLVKALLEHVALLI